MKTSTWDRSHSNYNIETADDVIKNIKNGDVDITADILGKSDIIDHFVTTLVDAMISRQISIREDEINIDTIASEEAYFVDAINRVCKNA